jgi:sec-independent protein translocase protein TatA
MLGGIGAQEIVIILIVGLLVFGATRLPKIARSLGQGIKEFKKTVKGIDEDEEETQTNVRYVQQPPPYQQQYPPQGGPAQQPYGPQGQYGAGGQGWAPGGNQPGVGRPDVGRPDAGQQSQQGGQTGPDGSSTGNNKDVNQS